LKSQRRKVSFKSLEIIKKNNRLKSIIPHFKAKHLLLILIFALPSISIAEFIAIKNKNCDESEVHVRKGERIFFSEEKSILGFGYTKSNGCKIVDFTQVVRQYSDQHQTEMLFSSKIGQRSTCREGLTKYQGPEFKTAFITKNKLVLQLTQEKQLV